MKCQASRYKRKHVFLILWRILNCFLRTCTIWIEKLYFFLKAALNVCFLLFLATCTTSPSSDKCVDLSDLTVIGSIFLQYILQYTWQKHVNRYSTAQSSCNRPCVNCHRCIRLWTKNNQTHFRKPQYLYLLCSSKFQWCTWQQCGWHRNLIYLKTFSWLYVQW